MPLAPLSQREWSVPLTADASRASQIRTATRPIIEGRERRGQRRALRTPYAPFEEEDGLSPSTAHSSARRGEAREASGADFGKGDPAVGRET